MVGGHLCIYIYFAAGFGLGALNDADEDDIDVYDGSFNMLDDIWHTMLLNMTMATGL
jgi:hypothetical protein